MPELLSKKEREDRLDNALLHEVTDAQPERSPENWAKARERVAAFRLAAESRNDQWLIWSNEHDGWWRQGYGGYTPDVREAGIYSYADALKIVASASIAHTHTMRPNETMMPLDSFPS